MVDLKKLLRNLTGRTDSILMGHLIDQITATHDGAQLARELLEGRISSTEAREEMRAIEHRGDSSREQLITEMAQALTTPIDREDVFRLSRSIDDVLDNLRDLVREYDLYGVTGTEWHVAVVAAVATAVDQLKRSLHLLTSDRGDVAGRVLEAKKAANNVRRMYQEGMAQLLNGEIDSLVLKRRELLRRIDVVGLRLGEAADALADGTMKRGY